MPHVRTESSVRRCLGGWTTVRRRRLSGRTIARLIALATSAIAVTDALGAKLGGAYNVDDADIGSLWSCEFENWASFAGNGDRIYVVSPACVFPLGKPVELGFNYVDMRSGGTWSSVLALTAKVTAIDPKVGQWGVALAGAVTLDLQRRDVNGFILNVPFTYDFSKQLRFNVNVGAQYDSDARAVDATLGAGVSWTFIEKWSWVSEAYAVIGPGQANPRLQTGIRYNPTKDIDCDVILGRNLTGEQANWITLAFTVRVNDK